MDIEIKEVQEIIKNLESSGELSIKEEKYLNVAKLCVQLAAERDAATLEYDYLNDQIEYWKNKSINITEQRNELDADLPPLGHENVHYADAAEMEIAALRQRIAELESRTVKLPQPHAHLIWIQAGHAPDDYWDDVEVSHSEKDRCCDGSERYPVYARWEIEEMLAAAGIKVEAE